jgi:hypothetical protein
MSFSCRSLEFSHESRLVVSPKNDQKMKHNNE